MSTDRNLGDVLGTVSGSKRQGGRRQGARFLSGLGFYRLSSSG